MTSEQAEQNPKKDQSSPKAVKRFSSTEEFRKEYYPKSTEQEAQRRTEEGEFGTDLALGSLDRHAGTLRF